MFDGEGSTAIFRCHVDTPLVLAMGLVELCAECFVRCLGKLALFIQLSKDTLAFLSTQSKKNWRAVDAEQSEKRSSYMRTDLRDFSPRCSLQTQAKRERARKPGPKKVGLYQESLKCYNNDCNKSTWDQWGVPVHCTFVTFQQKSGGAILVGVNLTWNLPQWDNHFDQNYFAAASRKSLGTGQLEGGRRIMTKTLHSQAGKSKNLLKDFHLKLWSLVGAWKLAMRWFVCMGWNSLCWQKSQMVPFHRTLYNIQYSAWSTAG